MGQKCEWCRLEMGSGWHLIRYFYEKKAIIILLSACTAQPTGGRYCSVAAILIASDQNWGEEFYSRPCGHNVTMLQHLGSYSVSPGHSGDG